MNLAGIIHRCADNYCYCLDDDYVIVNIRTGYDVSKVTICHGDPFSNGIMGSNCDFKQEETVITNKKFLENHIIWSVKLKPEFKRLAYYFILENEDETYIMLEDKFFTPSEYKKFTERKQVFTFPWMNPADIIRTPDWVNNTIWYQIFIDRFCNGNPDINPKDCLPWRKPDKSVKYHDFFGGDIPGITSKMDYLKKLGITGLYLTPICYGKSNHKYDTISYSKIDPAFGTDEDMATMVKTAHDNGIRVMMDGVFNHTGSFFKPWKDVIENGPESKYYDWFMINKWPFDHPMSHGANSKKGNFYTFAFHDGMPKLNTNNPSVIKYIIKTLKNWVLKYDIDGIRLDVAGDISHKLCKEIHASMKELKSDFYILGEIWHDSIAWLRGDEYDSVMNYPFCDGINEFWSNTSKTALDFEYSINRCYSLYPEQTNKVLFNLLDSHDTIRLISKLKNIHKFYQQLAVMFTMPGTVCIYYGTEIALEGGHDPDCRRCMPWAEINKGEYFKQMELMKEIIRLRKENEELRSNNYDFVHIPGRDRILCYERYADDSSKRIKIIINCEEDDYPISINKGSILFSLDYENGILEKDGILVYAM